VPIIRLFLILDIANSIFKWPLTHIYVLFAIYKLNTCNINEKQIYLTNRS
jgi:hypothetical protein